MSIVTFDAVFVQLRVFKFSGKIVTSLPCYFSIENSVQNYFFLFQRFRLPVYINDILVIILK